MILYRAAVATEIRHRQREIHVLAVPYNVPTPIRSFEGEFEEDFAPSAFAGTDERRVKALRDHAVDRAIGRTKTLDTRATDGLHAVLAVSATPLGDESLVLAADGVLDVSIGFVPRKGGDSWSRDMSRVTRTAVELLEISLVPLPAYAGASVLGVRSLTDTDTTQPARPTSPTPLLDQLEDEQRLERLLALYPQTRSTP